MKGIKFLLTISLLSFSAFAFANGAAPIGTMVYVPHNPAGWYLGLTGMYWEASNSALTYGIKDPNTDGYVNGNLLKVKPDHDLGFGITAGYRFANGDGILGVNYTRMHNKASDSASAGSGRIWATLIHPGYGPEYVTGNAAAKAEFDLDSFDLMAGQELKVGNLDMYGYAGLRYANIDSKLKATYYNPVEYYYVVNQTSEYWGIGPRFAGIGSYPLGKGFAIAMGGGCSLLIGDIKASVYEERNDSEGKAITVDVNKPSTRHVVPEFDGLLAISYTHAMNNYAFMAQLGWKVMSYISAKDAIRFSDYESRGVMLHDMSNVAFNGPYLTIGIAG